MAKVVSQETVREKDQVRERKNSPVVHVEAVLVVEVELIGRDRGPSVVPVRADECEGLGADASERAVVCVPASWHNIQR